MPNLIDPVRIFCIVIVRLEIAQKNEKTYAFTTSYIKKRASNFGMSIS